MTTTQVSGGRVTNVGVLDEDDEESIGKDEDDEDDEEKKEKDEGQSSTSMGTPAGITKDNCSYSMHKFMCYYFVNYQFAARTQNHYPWNYV